MKLRARVGAAGIAGLLALTMVACGDDDSSAGGSSSGSEKQLTIAFIPGCTCDPYYSTEIAGFKDEAKKQGVKAIVQGAAAFDPAQQTPVLQAVVRKKPDAIVIDPTDRRAMIAPIQAAIAAGIPVITTGNEINADIAVTKIAASSIEGGRQAAKFVAEQVGDKSGTVLINNTEPGVSSVDDRVKGFREGLASVKSLKVLPTQYNNDDQAKAASITSSTMRAHPDLVAVFGTNVGSAQGVANALRTSQKGKDIIAVGYDASQEQIQAMQAGALDAVISQDPRRIGALALQNAKKHVEGDKAIPKDQPLTPIVITNDNLKDPEIQKTIYR